MSFASRIRPSRSPKKDSDDVGVDEASDLRLPFLKIAVQPRILKRNRGLRRQQFQRRHPSRSEDVRSEIVLKVERPDELGLCDQGQAEYGSRAAVADIRELEQLQIDLLGRARREPPEF